MGEVYRARDPKRNRDVAPEILPELSPDPDRLTRFARQVQVLALNHPHIAANYGFEELHGGRRLSSSWSRVPSSRIVSPPDQCDRGSGANDKSFAPLT